MAKTTKKAVQKSAEVKTEKKVEKTEETKKLTTAKEPKKITAKAEPKKISAKAEPKKIAAKETVKLSVKEETPVAVKTAVKKETSKKPAVKKETSKKEAVKKETPKKDTVKKVTAKKEVVKKEPKKEAVKKTDKKVDQYNEWSLEECIQKMQAMHVGYSYDDYFMLLMDEGDLSKIEQNILLGNDIKNKNLTFEKDGYDEDLVLVTLQKVADTMDIKASDYKVIKKQITNAMKYTVSEDTEKNAEHYLEAFSISEKLLMIGQRKGIASAKEVGELVGVDVNNYFHHFFDFAYEILPAWQYNDVKFYEDFAYAIMSQYVDVFEAEQLRVQIDIADLYIKHGDYQHGDEMYGYILRDNSIKDYIYYRYASIYKDVDYNKAKSIAYSALQYVDDRYTYFPNIMEIINQ